MVFVCLFFCLFVCLFVCLLFAELHSPQPTCNTLFQVTLAMAEDEPRFRDMINSWITDEVVPDFPQFTQEPEAKRKRRKKRYEREKAEANEVKMEEGGQL